MQTRNYLVLEPRLSRELRHSSSIKNKEEDPSLSWMKIWFTQTLQDADRVRFKIKSRCQNLNFAHKFEIQKHQPCYYTSTNNCFQHNIHELHSRYFVARSLWSWLLCPRTSAAPSCRCIHAMLQQEYKQISNLSTLLPKWKATTRWYFPKPEM